MVWRNKMTLISKLRKVMPKGQFLPHGKRAYEIKRLNERQKEVLRRILLGQKNVEIAEALNITPQNVSDIRNSELAKIELAALSSLRDGSTINVANAIREVAPAALNILTTTIERTNKMLAEDPTMMPTPHSTNIAQDLLDRAGHSAVKKSMVGLAELTRDEIEDLKERASQAKNVVKADYKEVN